MSGKIPFAGPALLIYKLRTGGLQWLFRRVRHEIEMPRTKAGQATYRTLRGIGRSLSPARNQAATAKQSDILYAFYDLAAAPITFDFLWFLIAAELERRKRKLSSIHLVIVPGKENGVRKEDEQYERIVDGSSRLARISNILVPACSLLPTVSGITIASSREEVQREIGTFGTNVIPVGYEPTLPSYISSKGPLDAARAGETDIGALRATKHDLDRVDQWLARRAEGRQLITITLREYNFMPARNSNLAAWTAFARQLDPSKYFPVFVRDTDAAFDPLPAGLDGFTLFNEAAFNLGLRMALYERAYVNLGVNNGPMGLCWLNERTRYLTFKMITPGVPQTDSEYFGFLGFVVGESLPFARIGQELVWENDDAAIIENHFAAAVARISA